MELGSVFPVINLSQASAHSRITSMAYLQTVRLTTTPGRFGILLVLALAGECELVLGLAVRNLVDAEPLIGGAEQAGEMALNILDVL